MSENPTRNDDCGCCAEGASLNTPPGQATDADRDCAKKQADSTAQNQPQQLQSIDFSTFMFSMATQALALMGEARIPGHELPKDLPAAKQTIDILEMLERKTAGNLSETEAKLLSNLLYDLRVRYVRNARGQENPA